MSEAESEYAQAAQRWRLRGGFHLLVQGAAPDALAPGLNDSPAGLAAWLVDKYRRWSDCDGEVERRFSKDDLCDFLTLYWATETIAPRCASTPPRRAIAGAWRRASGSRCRPRSPTSRPRSCARRAPGRERVLADLRRWTEFDRGGHFAAFEEPELLGRRPDRVPRRALSAAARDRDHRRHPHAPRSAPAARGLRRADRERRPVHPRRRLLDAPRSAPSSRPSGTPLVAVHGNVDDAELRARLPGARPRSRPAARASP